MRAIPLYINSTLVSLKSSLVSLSSTPVSLSIVSWLEVMLIIGVRFLWLVWHLCVMKHVSHASHSS